MDEDFGEEDDPSGEEGYAQSGPMSFLRGKKKLIVIIAITIVIVFAGAAGVMFSGVADSLFSKSKAVKKPTAENANGVQGPAFLNLPEIMVNLNTNDGKQHYLKMHITLELGSPLDVPAIDAAVPRIGDVFQTYLRELSIADINGSSGVSRMKDDLLFRVNGVVKPTTVVDVLFTDLLVQ